MSNETKQTAVEWLVEQIMARQLYTKEMLEEFEQAKEMEKEQIRKAYCDGEHYKDTKLTTDYYNETYGGNK